MWLNMERPEVRDSIDHPIEPMSRTPASNPMMTAKTTAEDDRPNEDRPD
jgi:hypothetical protein